MRDTISPAQISRRPHRLVAQDGALSRPKQGFESPWGHRFAKDRQHRMLSGFCLCLGLIQEEMNALGRFAGSRTIQTGISRFESDF